MRKARPPEYSRAVFIMAEFEIGFPSSESATAPAALSSAISVSS